MLYNNHMTKLPKTPHPTHPNQPISTTNTLYKVQRELKDLVAYLQANQQIKTKAQLFRDLETSSSKFYKKVAKYSYNKQVQDLSKKITEVLEARLIEHGLENKNFAFVIFLLKNSHGYTDKKEIETETTHIFNISRGDTSKVIKLDSQLQPQLPKGKAKGKAK